MALAPRTEARRLASELKLDTLPVDLTKICNALGIEVIYDSLRGVDGFFIYNGERERTFIVVSDSVGLARQRFSVAHELAHIRLHRRLIGFYETGQIKRNPRLEAEANTFASELLMPKILLCRFGCLAPEEIATICQVSWETANIRAQELGWL